MTVPPLENDEAHVWKVDIDRCIADIEHYHQILSPDERDGTDRLRFEKDRIRHIVTHGVLRLLIGGYLKIEPRRINYTFNQYRKPEIAQCGGKKLRFNLSHSGKRIIYGFAWDRQVGIDIELMRKTRDADGIIRRFCSEREKRAYFAFPPNLRPRIFLACWTRKEAYLKARGDGLYFPLTHFSVSVDPDLPPVLLDVRDEPMEKDRWTFHEFLLNHDYISTMAIENGNVTLRYLEWPGLPGSVPGIKLERSPTH